MFLWRSFNAIALGLQWDMVILPGMGNKGVGVDTALLAMHGGAISLMAAKASIRQKDTLYSLVSNIEKDKDNNELKRLLYVACTRSETELHMFGHVHEKHGEAAAGSLLQLLLGADEYCFGAQIWHIEGLEEAVSGDALTLQRLSQIPSLGAESQQQEMDEEVADEGLAETEYIWAGVEAAPVGTALHAALQCVGEIGVEDWSEENHLKTLQLMSRMLIAEGLSGVMLKAASKRCADGLQRVLSSERGKWILSRYHQQAHCEWALSMEHDHHVSHHIIDRSFIDHDGQRWIIDYKTASHEGGHLDDFLSEEKKRHAPQLRRYASVLHKLEPEMPVKTALYFPMLDAWVECSE